MLLLALVACAPDASAPSSACADGEVEDAGRCVPDRCGVGPWGDLARDADTVHVSPDGADDAGDGSEGAPFATLGVAVDVALAGGGGRVVMAEGAYLETLNLESGTGLEIAGRCADLVTLDGSAGEEGAAAIEVDGPVQVTFSGLTVTGGRWAGLLVNEGTVGFSDGAMVANEIAGAVASGDGSTLALARVEILDNLPYSESQGGMGLQIESGATVTLEDVILRNNRDAGIRTTDRTATLEATRCTIADTRPVDEPVDGMVYGRGLDLVAGKVTLDDCVVTGNHEVGVAVSAGTLDATDLHVEGTLPGLGEELGYGLGVLGGRATVTGGTIEANTNANVASFGGTTTLVDVALLAPRTAAIESAFGIHAAGGTVEMSGGTIEDSVVVAVQVLGADTEVELDGVSIGPVSALPDADPAASVEELAAVGSIARAVQVDEGGSATLLGTTIDGADGVAVYVNGGGSASLKDGCSVTGTLPMSDAWEARALWVVDGELDVRDATLEGNAGLAVAAGGTTAHVDLRRTLIADAQNVPGLIGGGGILLNAGAVATLEEVEIRDVYRAAIALTSEGPDASVLDATDVRVVGVEAVEDGASGFGLYAGAFADIDATRLTIEDARSLGLNLAGAGVVATLTDLEVRGTRMSSEGAFGRAMELAEGAQITISGGSLDDNHESAILLSDDGTRLEADDLAIRGTRRTSLYAVATGLSAQVGATLAASGLTIENTEGPGLYVTRAADASCDGCTFSGNTFAGVVKLQQGPLTLTDCVVEDNGPDPSEGGGVGVFVDARGEEASLTLTSSDVGPHTYAGVWLQGAGAYVLAGSSIAGSEGVALREDLLLHGDAVYVTGGVTPWDGVTGLLLGGDELHGARGAGLFLDGASATGVGNTFPEDGRDVVQQRCEGVDAAVGFDDADGSWCESAAVTVPLSFAIYLEESGAEEQ